MPAPEYARQKADELWTVEVFVQPGAKKSVVDGVHDGRLKVRLQAPPVEGKANKALAAYLAKVFGVRKRQVRLVRGEKSRRKTVEVASGEEPRWPA